ncbi:multidrug effflux MFS transporter [Mesorhizobium sp. L-8-10]|uniref:multidrug effflux MFS transporter n=1 Tax=Mesorhizobium sp. L-8-10 TaxID=2744523 RepID=UPI001927C503|nr:multidrug effflux MFS transporter [Mesorhizobium sp. L-8-10]
MDMKVPSQRLLLTILVFLTALPLVSINIFLPSMPTIIDEFGGNVAAGVSTVSIYLAGVGIGQLFYGPISDVYGRKISLVAGMSVFAVGSLICTLAGSIELFLLGRFVQSFGAASAIVIARILARDVYGSARAASILGYTLTAATVAAGLSPFAGGALDGMVGWRGVFATLVVAGVLMAVVCLIGVRDGILNRPLVRDRVNFATVFAITRRPSFLMYALFSACLFGSWQAFLAGVSIVVIGLWGYSQSEFSAWWLVVSLSYMVGTMIAGRYSTIYGKLAMIGVGSILIVAGASMLLAMALFDFRHPLGLFPPMSILLIGFGAAEPSAAAGALEASPDRLGVASAILGTMQVGFSILAISVVAYLPFHTALPLVSVSVGMALAAVALHYALRKVASP